LAHPECKKELLDLADFIGSTAALLSYSGKSDKTQFIVATESGILHQMKKDYPEKTFIPVPPETGNCACNECNYMRMNTMEKLYNCLKNESPEIIVDKEVAEKAVRPIIKMLEMSN
jgi:quinolinate synthase